MISSSHDNCDKLRHPLLHVQKTHCIESVIANGSLGHLCVFGDFKVVLIPGNLKQLQRPTFWECAQRNLTAPGQQDPGAARSLPESSLQK